MFAFKPRTSGIESDRPLYQLSRNHCLQMTFLPLPLATGFESWKFKLPQSHDEYDDLVHSTNNS